MLDFVVWPEESGVGPGNQSQGAVFGAPVVLAAYKRGALGNLEEAYLIDDYAEVMKKRVKFPPVVLFSSEDKYFVGDGYHRIEAAIKIGRKVIQAIIHPGGYAAALKYAAGANDEHGLRRTQADPKLQHSETRRTPGPVARRTGNDLRLAGRE